MRNMPFRETDFRGDALRRVAELLPPSWSIDRGGEAEHGDKRLDAVVDLIGPTGTGVSFVVEAKRSGAVPTQFLLTALREQTRRSGLPVLFVSDYIGAALRAALTDEGMSFADATGWVRVTCDDPLVLLTGQGAERSPRPPRPNAVIRLNGLAASRTIRALSTTDPPVGVRDLAGRAGVSPGSVSKLLATLAAEGIVDRDERGAVTAVRRRALIQRWVRDYAFTKPNESVGYYIALRGLDHTLARLAERGGATLTGSAAARRLLPDGTTPVVPLRLLALYAASPGTLARELGLIDADPATANVMIAAPQDDQILPQSDDPPLSLAPVALVLADLLTLPNRSDAEAEQLLDALARLDTAWKQ